MDVLTQTKKDPEVKTPTVNEEQEKVFEYTNLSALLDDIKWLVPTDIDPNNPPLTPGVPIIPKRPMDRIRLYMNGADKRLYVYNVVSNIWEKITISVISISNTVSLNFGAIAPHSSADLTMALTGALVGEPVGVGVEDLVISTGTNCNNITFFAWVSAPDVITIRCTNNDAVNTANPAQGNFTSKIMKI